MNSSFTIIRAKLRPSLALLSLAAGPLYAGNYTNDFSSGTNGLTIYNRNTAIAGPEVRTDGGNPGGYFKLTDAVGSAGGTVIFPNFEAGTAVESFDFKIDCRVGAGTNPPADGFSISFVRPGDDLLDDGNGFSSSPGGEGNLPEEGSKSGLAIGFDVWDSGSGDVVGFSVKLDGVTVTQVAAGARNPQDGVIVDGIPTPPDPLSLETGPQGGGVEALTWQPFRANLKADGTLDVYWKGTKVIDNLITGYTPSPGQIVFAARTGGSNAAFHFDNLSLTTAAVSKAQLSSALLTNSGYIIKVTDLGTTSVFQAVTTGPNAITLSIDGSAVPLSTGNVSKSGGVTTITLPAPSVPDPGTSHTFTINGKDQIGASINASGAVRAPIFPVVVNGPEGAVGSWGMREWHKGSGLTPGLTGNSPLGAVVIQTANLNPGDAGITDATGVPVVNHSDPEDPGGRGNFNNDLPFIANVPGAGDNDVVMIGKTKLRIPAAGEYTFAVHSDDGAGIRISGGPSGNTGKFVRVTGDNTQIDQGDPQTASFNDYTGDSNLHAVYNFSAPGDYDLLMVAFEGGGGAFWEIAWAPGSFGADTDTSTWSLVGNPGDPSIPPFTPRFATTFNGPPGTAGNFGIRTYRNASGVDNLGKASNFVRDTTRQPNDGTNETVDALRPYLNARDPQDGQGGVLIGNDPPYPGDQPGAQDNVVTVAKGRITVPAASYYTFWGQGDDGFLLRIKGVNGAPNPKFSRSTQGGNDRAGRFEMSNPSELFFENGTGNSDTRGIILLAAGEYDLEYLQWDGGGGFWYELTAAQGEWPHGTTPPNGWQAVGYDVPGNGTVLIPGMLNPGWTVQSSTPGRPEFHFNIADAEAAIDATLADPTAPAAKTSTWDSLNFIDPQDGNDGSFTPNNPWPLNTPNGDDNYAMRATGTLHITEAGEYFLGFQGDDGGYMTLNGPGNPVFSAIEFTNHPDQAIITEEVSGSGFKNSIRVETGTGNSRTIVRTTLAVGDYTLKTMMYEGGGGSWWEVLGSKASGHIFNVPLLVKGTGSTATDTEGLLLTAQPQANLAVNAFTADPQTGDFSITFGSILGNDYSLEYTTGFLAAGGAASPLKWNTVPVAELASFPGNGQSTTITGNVSSLLTNAGGQLTDLSRVFLRVRRLAPAP